MKKKPADLATFNVKKPATAPAAPKIIEKRPSKLMTKGFRVTPEAAHQFEMLRAEIGMGKSKDIGPQLIAEALNLLFAKYGKAPIA